MRISFSIFFIFWFSFIFSQGNKEDLNKQREKIKKEIEYASKLLETTTNRMGSNIEKVKFLDSRIQRRFELIASYDDEIRIIDLKINEKEESIKRFGAELEKQKKLYADFIYFSYKNIDEYSVAQILMASDNVNQFYLRKKYIEQLNTARKNKIILIDKLKKKIQSELILLMAEKKNKEAVIDKLKKEYNLLNNEKFTREKLIKDLRGEEKRLKEQIAEKKRVENEIANRLEELIREEAKKSSFAKLTPEQKLVSDEFEKNKGRLPWPTRQGIITEKYGEHKHPVIKDLIVRNDGIDISTPHKEPVRVVFNGEVSKIFAIKGANYTVIVKHGTYYTVYNNIENVNVNVGQKVSTKQELGYNCKSRTGENYAVHFQLYKGIERLNPEEWISK